jgi:hypothetical protein
MPSANAVLTPRYFAVKTHTIGLVFAWEFCKFEAPNGTANIAFQPC